MQWEEKWTNHDVGARNGREDSRLTSRMSALLEMCPKDVKEQMMTRMDEIGENYDNLKAKAVSYTTNMPGQTQGGQREMHAPMEVDHVHDVDEFRGGSVCFDCGKVGHFARDYRWQGQGKGETSKHTGKKCSGKTGGSKGGYSRDQKHVDLERSLVFCARVQLIQLVCSIHRSTVCDCCVTVTTSSVTSQCDCGFVELQIRS